METYLEEEGERHPLIVTVESSITSKFIAQSRAGNLSAYSFPVLPG